MLLEFSEYLFNNYHLVFNKPIVVGFSGGPDSFCLVHLIKSLGYSVVVVHLNHGLRPEADEESKIVTEIARDLDVPLELTKLNVGEYAKRNKLTVEEAARSIRYRFLFTQAKKYQAQAVAVGHTADDQVETIFMHILRGTGLAGLRGMLSYSLPNPWSRTISLIRPLLGFWRQDVLIYCNENHLSPILDKSNLEMKYFRNRIRHELIPLLEKNYNPKTKKMLWQMADTLACEHELLNKYYEEMWNSCVIEYRKEQIRFKLDYLREQPKAFQRYVVRKSVSLICPDLTDIDYQMTEKAVGFINDLPHSRTTHHEILCGISLLKENKALAIFSPKSFYRGYSDTGLWPQLIDKAVIKYPVPGKLYIPSMLDGEDGHTKSWCFISELVKDIPKTLAEAEINTDPFQAWLDISKMEKDPSDMGFYIRARSSGDKFQPLGLNGHAMKLSDFMINVKIPHPARSGWPLVCINNEIVWVPGYRISHTYRMTEATQFAIHIRLQ